MPNYNALLSKSKKELENETSENDIDINKSLLDSMSINKSEYKLCFFDEIPCGKNGGSPKLKLNENGKTIIQKLAFIQCTIDEIANIMNTSEDTLKNETNKETFYFCYKKGREQGRECLRRAQYDLAIKNKNAVMLIWLGKQYLGQCDAIEQHTEQAITINGSIPTKEKEG